MSKAGTEIIAGATQSLAYLKGDETKARPKTVAKNPKAVKKALEKVTH